MVTLSLCSSLVLTLQPFSLAYPIVWAPGCVQRAPLPEGRNIGGNSIRGWPWCLSRGCVPTPTCGQARAESLPRSHMGPQSLLIASGNQWKLRHFVCCQIHSFLGDELPNEISDSQKTKHHESGFLPSPQGPYGSTRPVHGLLDSCRGDL